MTATFFVGDAIEVMGKLPEKSVDLILTSPPFLALRSYLPADHPDKALEGGSQATPGVYIDWLIDVVEACDRVLAPHGSLCIELGDTYAGSGGAGGDYLKGGWRDGQNGAKGSKYAEEQFAKSDPKYGSSNFKGGGPGGTGWPLPKSLSLIPELFRLTLVYGTNPLTGRTTERWRLRNVVRWVRPNPPVGALGDKFRPATSELMVFCKSAKRYFDLDAVREPNVEPGATRRVAKTANNGLNDHKTFDSVIRQNPAGAPPLDWWQIPMADLLESSDLVEELHEALAYLNQTTDDPMSMFSGHSMQVVLAAAHSSLLLLKQEQEQFALGAPPLDWWNIPPGGFSGAHYAVWPPELLIKPIKAMCPSRVCRVCGEPSRRITATQPELDGQRALADEIIRRRRKAGVSRAEMVPWFPHYKNGESVTAQVSNWELAKNVPSPGDWEILKERLGVSDAFDGLVNSDRRWTESEVTYEHVSDYPSGNTQDATGRVYQRLASRKDRIPPDRFSDCGCSLPCEHGQTVPHVVWKAPGKPVCPGVSEESHWRPGLVLDPFGGSGTTALVATGHGRDCILIDLDERNYDLALQRVGPFILSRAS